MHEQAQIGGPSGEERGNPQSCGFHELSELFPLMDEAALDKLADDIRKHGLREPIVLHEGLILDGRNRYRACQLAGVEPRYREFDGCDPTAHVVSANLHRRHLDESQRAMVAEKLANMRQGERTDLEPSANVPKVSQREAADRLNVGERSVRYAAVVRNHGAPELVSAVEQGTIPVSRAAEIARKPIEQQRRKTSNRAATKPRSRRKPVEDRAPELSSLSWSQATPEMRARFVDAVGLNSIWDAAEPRLRAAFIERRRSEWEQPPERPAADERETAPLNDAG